MFRGSIVALLTPMHTNQTLDIDRLKSLIQRHIEMGTNAIVLMGTTGEAPTLTHAERATLFKAAKEAAQGKIPLIIGTGTYSTAESIHLTQQAKDLGADACLIVTPYYNKPTQDGLYLHYETIAKKIQIPIILYNVPGRTSCDLLPETVARLAEIPNIVGLKEATPNVDRLHQLKKLCGNSLDFYSGDDATAMEFMLNGGQGVISVTANVAPKEMSEMCTAALSQNRALAEKINEKLMRLHEDLFVEANPIPVKWAAQKLGWIEPGIRLPLTQLSQKYHETLIQALKYSGVLA